MARTVFLSFAAEDQWLAHALRRQAESRSSGLEFRDYAVSEPFERARRINVERLIRECSATICLVGKTTWRSDAVNWEIRKSRELRKRVIAVRLSPDVSRYPEALIKPGVTIVPRDIEEVARALGVAA